MVVFQFEIGKFFLIAKVAVSGVSLRHGDPHNLGQDINMDVKQNDFRFWTVLVGGVIDELRIF